VANHLEQVLDAGEAQKDTNVLLLLIGPGMEKARVMKMADDRKITNVRFLDSVPKAEVFRYILASEMGASILKRVDTFKTVYSNKTFDYMSCKKPILMAIDGVSRELVEDAGAGTYVEPENASEYSRIIREYLANPERLKKEGESGYRFAKENFDRELLAKKYIQYINDVIKKK
jgi:glycosyltransferase involved in cell wall biosynthesis